MTIMRKVGLPLRRMSRQASRSSPPTRKLPVYGLTMTATSLVCLGFGFLKGKSEATKKQTKEKKESEEKTRVSIISLRGIVAAGGGDCFNLRNMRETVDQAFAPPNLEQVVLDIDCPGGSPVQSDLLSSYIKRKAESQSIPVVAIIEEDATSGGYWLACTADHIYCTKGSDVGGIGVISSHFGYEAALEKLGVERRVLTAGKNKNKMDAFLPLQGEDVAKYQASMENIHRLFIAHVRASRGERLVGVEEELFSGDYWPGERAVELGLVDGIRLLEDWLQDNFGEEGSVLRLDKEDKDGEQEEESHPLASLLPPFFQFLAQYI